MIDMLENIAFAAAHIAYSGGAHFVCYC